MGAVFLTIAMLLGVFQNAEPKVVQRVEPSYPALARAARVSSDVKLAVVVNPDGSVKDIKVSTGHPLLNNAAVEAMQQWKFSATPSGGTVNVTLPFVLAEPPTVPVTGRVVDAEGRPLADMAIGLTKPIYRSGKRAWAPVLSGTRTDERGEYKLSAEPGEFFVTATYSAVNRDQADAVRSQRVFFPGTTDPATSVPIRLTLGSPAVADIRMPRFENSSGVKLAGKILIPALDQPPRAALDVQLVRVDSRHAPEAVARQSTQLENRSEIPLELRNLQPGSYLLAATLITGPPNWAYSALLPLEIRDRDIEGLTFPIHRNIEFKGRLVTQVPGTRLETLRVYLSGRTGLGGGAVFPVAADGTVRLFNVPAEDYNVTISGALGNAYVREMRLGVSSIYTEGFIAVRDQPLPDLEIVLGANGGSIDGTVATAARVPVTNALVVLVPDVGRRQNPLFYKSGKSNDTGTFRFTGIAPGEYTLFAFEALPPEGATESAEFMARYEQRGVRVVIREGTVLPGLSLSVIPRQ
jgi:TonB family protein